LPPRDRRKAKTIILLPGTKAEEILLLKHISQGQILLPGNRYYKAEIIILLPGTKVKEVLLLGRIL